MTKRCELYLRLATDDLPSPDALEAMIAAGRPAAALLMLSRTTTNAPDLSNFIELANRQGLAILIENDASIAYELGVEGAHIRNGLAVPAARQLLGEEKSIGVSCPLSRHEAMILAEGGADYLAFGDPAIPGASDIDAVVEMIAWWNELFEVPCVAWLDDGESEALARAMIGAGADFLCVDTSKSGARPRTEFLGRIASIADEAIAMSRV